MDARNIERTIRVKTLNPLSPLFPGRLTGRVAPLEKQGTISSSVAGITDTTNVLQPLGDSRDSLACPTLRGIPSSTTARYFTLLNTVPCMNDQQFWRDRRQIKPGSFMKPLAPRRKTISQRSMVWNLTQGIRDDYFFPLSDYGHPHITGRSRIPYNRHTLGHLLYYSTTVLRSY